MYLDNKINDNAVKVIAAVMLLLSLTKQYFKSNFLINCSCILYFALPILFCFDFLF